MLFNSIYNYKLKAINMVCRLCLQNRSEVLEIFNNKGQELKMAMVIGKHFWFEPKKEDPVSSHICHWCWTKVSDFHEFYKSIETAQQLLTVEVIVKTEYNLTVCDISVEDVKLASIHGLEENIEEQCEDPFNITSNALADDLQVQSVEKKKDEQSEVCKKTNDFRRALYSHKNHIQQSDGKYVCNICKKSFKMAKSLEEHMLKHKGRSLYRCPHCSRTFNYVSNMESHRKQKHPKEFEEFRKLIKISSHRKDVIIPTISSLSDATMNAGDLPSEQYEEPFNITSDMLAENNSGEVEFEFPPDLEYQSIGVVSNEKKKDDQDISAMDGDKENESVLPSERNKVEYVTEKATTANKGRRRPCKDEDAHFKNKSNCNEEKVVKLRIYNGPSGSNLTTQEISEYLQLKCDVCGIEFNTFGDIRKHMRPVHGVRPYVKCCEKKFASHSALYNHIKFHLNPDIFKCEKCCKTFSNKLNLSKHVIYMHQSEVAKTFQCPECPKKFARNYILQTHITRLHSKVLKYFCPECKRGFPYKYALRSHKALRHSSALNKHKYNKDGSDVKYECNICKKSYIKAISLKEHMAQHTGLSLYHCLFCSRTFNNNTIMYIHRKKNHPKEYEQLRKNGKHECNICKKFFKKARSLKDHMTQHTGPLYPCLHCGRRFNNKSNMYRHRKKKHPKEYEEILKLRKISTRSNEPIIPIISSLSNVTKNSGEFVPLSCSVLALTKEKQEHAEYELDTTIV